MGNGILYGMSVGPGDPELLTLKAARVLARCAVVAAPQTPAGGMLALDIARQAVDLSAKRILPLRFAMSRDAQTREAAHRAAIQALRAELDAGGDVALLNLGDVTVYSSFGHIQGDLVAAGYRVEMIPGVTSFCAAAARLGRPLNGGMEEPLCIVPGRAGSDLLRAPGAKAFLKSGRDLPRLLEDLAQAGLLSRSALVARCGLPGEEVYPDLSRAQPQGDPDYFTTVLVKGEEE